MMIVFPTLTADQWERTKMNEQTVLNRRIQALTAEKLQSERESKALKEKLSEAEAKLEAKEKEFTELAAQAKEVEEEKLGAATKRALGLQFIIAELVAAWPEVPVYAMPEPAGGSSDDDDESDSDESSDGERGALEIEAGSGDESEDDDEDGDSISIDDDAGGDGSAKKKKKKKRGKRGGKKKKGPGSPSGDPAALPPPPPELTKRPSEAEEALAALASEVLAKAPKAVTPKKKKRRPPPPMPMVMRRERAPLPPGLVVPAAALTRKEFMDLAGVEGLTRKQLNRLEGLLEPGGANSGGGGGGGDDEAVADLVDEALGCGLNACCGASGSLRIVKLLLAHGANPSHMSQEFDASPVHRAVQFGHDNVFGLLLAAGVNVNATDPHLGRTPLHFAAQYNRPTLAKQLVGKGAMVDAVDNAGETATAIAERLKWKRVVTVLTDPSVLFWNFANRANKLYKAMEYELAIAVYEKAFAILGDVKPSPSAQNKATLHYNCARAAGNIGRQLAALAHCDTALGYVPRYLSALEQRAKCNLALYNYKQAADDCDTLSAEGATAENAAQQAAQWATIKREAQLKLGQTHFDLLGIQPSATAAEVKKAYRTQCIAWHPDKHVTTDDAKHRAHIMFQKVNEAHEVLSDPAKRRTYEYANRLNTPRPASPHYTGGYNAYGGGASANRWPYSSACDFDDSDEDGNL